MLKNPVSILVIFLVTLGLVLVFTSPTSKHDTTTPDEITKVEDIRLTICKEAIDAGIDPETALRIARCESQYGKYSHNLSGSGATGLYQFLPATFGYYCNGDINNDIDQLKCFLELYPKHPNWWECK